MEINLYVFISLIVFYALTLLILSLYYFWSDIVFSYKYRNKRDKLVRCFFIMPNAILKRVYLLHDEHDMIEFGEGTYVVNKECGVYEEKRNLLTMLYVFGNPNPLDLKNMSKINVPNFDTESLKKALKLKFIRDLLAESNKMLLLLILLIVNIGISAIMALKLFGVFK